MTNIGPVPARRNRSGAALLNCVLCGGELPADFGPRSGSTACPHCGLGLRQLDATPTALPIPAPAKTKPADPEMKRLDQWLSGEALTTTAEGDWQKFRRWMRRHPRLSRLAVAATVGVAVVTTGSLTAYLHTDLALHRTSVERDAAEQKRLELSAAVSRSAAELKLAEERCQNQQQSQRELEEQYQKLKADYERCQQLGAGADQRLRKAVHEARLSLAEQLNRRAIEIKNSMPETSLMLATEALSITQQEGTRPIPAALQQVRDVLATTDGRALSSRTDPIAVMAASRDGNWLASGDSHGSVQLWATNSHAQVDVPKLFHGQWDRITELLFTSDSRWLISVSSGSTICLWDLTAADPIAKRFFLDGKPGRIVSTALSEDGRWLAAASTRQNSKDNCVRLWDLHAKEMTANPIRLPKDLGEIRTLALSPKGDRIACGDSDGIARLWRIDESAASVSATTLHVCDAAIRKIGFSPDGNWMIAAAGSEGDRSHTLRAWKLAAASVAAEPVILNDNSGSVQLFTFSVDGKLLITASDEPVLHVWDLASLETHKSSTLLNGQTAPTQGISFSADGRWLAATGTDGTVCLWTVGADGPMDPPVMIRPSAGQATGVAFAGKGDWIVTGSDKGAIQLWNLKVDDMIRMANSKLMP
jgi:WD40 repeat protein